MLDKLVHSWYIVETVKKTNTTPTRTMKNKYAKTLDSDTFQAITRAKITRVAVQEQLDMNLSFWDIASTMSADDDLHLIISASQLAEWFYQEEKLEICDSALPTFLLARSHSARAQIKAEYIDNTQRTLDELSREGVLEQVIVRYFQNNPSKIAQLAENFESEA